MTKPLEVGRAAETDIRNTRAFYESRLEGLGKQFAEEVTRTLGRIEEQPHMYPVLRRETRRARLHRFPHVVLYRELETKIIVVGVLHPKRSSDAFLSRTK